MKIVVITGEESGDKLAASAIKELKKFQMSLLKFTVLVEELLKKRVFKNFLIYQTLTSWD